MLRYPQSITRCTASRYRLSNPPSHCNVADATSRSQRDWRIRAVAKQETKQALSDACQQLDKLLSDPTQASEEKALAFVNDNRDKFRAYGAAKQVPKRIYSIEELRLNNIDAPKIIAPKDESINYVRSVLQAALAAGSASLYFFGHVEAGQIGSLALGLLFLLAVDQIANQGGGEALIVDTVGRLLLPKYKSRVAYHEAGHFLVAYLIGFLPKAYTLTALDAFTKYGAFNIQAGTLFCDSEFSREVASGRLSSSSLEKYGCVALAGVVSEYLCFGRAEGGLGDVNGLDHLFNALKFSQLKADGEVRWAVLNVASILRRHKQLHDQLAQGMIDKASVGKLVSIIEAALADSSDI